MPNAFISPGDACLAPILISYLQSKFELAKLPPFFGFTYHKKNIADAASWRRTLSPHWSKKAQLARP